MAKNSDGYWYGLGQASGNRNSRLSLGGSGGLYDISVYTNIVYNDFTKHNYLIKDSSITIDNTTTYSVNTKNDFSTVYPIAIFANNKVGNIVEYSCAKLYTFKMYNKNNLVRDFIPCYSTTTVTDVNGNVQQSGTIGLYDMVQGKFYTNAASGTFLKGADVD